MGSGASASEKYTDVSDSNLEHASEVAKALDDEQVIDIARALKNGDLNSVKKNLEKQQQEVKQSDSGKSMLLESLGGLDGIRSFRPKSESIIAAIHASAPQSRRGLQQHMIYEGAGLEKLLADGAKVKPVFDDWGQKVCARWTSKFDLVCEFVAVPIKSLTRAAVKVRVDLNGKQNMLKDVCRGTVNVKSPPSKETLQQLYDALEDLAINAAEVVPGLPAKIIRLKDRYQKPAGPYRDFLINVRVKNLICELQVNFATALEQKLNKDHEVYEFDRMAKANLLDASMRGDATAVKVALSTGVDIRGLTDSNRCTPLTYAAAYGSQEMVSALLRAGAEPLAIDASGWLPIHHALSQSLGDVAAMLLDSMLELDMSDLPTLMGPALAEMYGLVLADSSLHFLDEKALQVWNSYKPSKAVKIVHASAAGQIQVARKLLQTGDTSTDVLSKSGMYNEDSGLFNGPMDWAVWGAGSPDMVRLLAEYDIGFDCIQVQGHENPQRMALVYAASDRVGSLSALLEAEDLKVKGNIPTDGETNQVWPHTPWGSDRWPGTPLDRKAIVEEAASKGSLKALRIMIQAGFKLDEPSAALEQRLCAAAGAGDTEYCQLLLDAGVEVSSLISGNALSRAAAQGHVSVCKFLIGQKADLNFQNSQTKNFPAYDAAAQGRLKVIELLYNSRADFTLTNIYGKTPLARAEAMGKLKAACLIKELQKQERSGEKDVAA